MTCINWKFNNLTKSALIHEGKYRGEVVYFIIEFDINCLDVRKIFMIEGSDVTYESEDKIKTVIDEF